MSYNFLFWLQVLFVYPPEKQLPLNYKDLLSFCFPAGVEVGLSTVASFASHNSCLSQYSKNHIFCFLFNLLLDGLFSGLLSCNLLIVESVKHAYDGNKSI